MLRTLEPSAALTVATNNGPIWGCSSRLAVLWSLVIYALFYVCLFYFTGGKIDTTYAGMPERLLQDRYFKENVDTQTLSAPPVTWVRADPPGDNQVPMPTTVSTTWLSNTLKMVQDQSAAVVILDVDIAFSSGDKNEKETLKQTLRKWANSSAPMLLIARETFKKTSPVGGSDFLPVTGYDEIVSGAKNIKWASSELCSDSNGIVRSIPFARKVKDAQGSETTLSAIPDVVAQTILSPNPKPIKPNQFQGCDNKVGSFKDAAPRLIHWHLGSSEIMNDAGIERAQTGSWQLPKECKTVSTKSLTIFATDGTRVVEPSLCGHVVILGASDQIIRDRSQTPIGELEGPINLANAIRSNFPASGIITTASPNSLRSIILHFLLALVAAIFASVLDSERVYQFIVRLGFVRSTCIRAFFFLLFEFVILVCLWLLAPQLVALSLYLNVAGCISASIWSFLLTRWIIRYTKLIPSQETVKANI
jgi:hypothetical protein